MMDPCGSGKSVGEMQSGEEELSRGWRGERAEPGKHDSMNHRNPKDGSLGLPTNARFEHIHQPTRGLQ